MPREPRAILFDLDDTLYPLRQFVLSGFREVARHLAEATGRDERPFYLALARASRRGRGRELQACVRRFGLPVDLVPGLIDVIRGHRPSLRLPSASAHALRALRPGWRIAIVTNGVPEIQARKIVALGLGAAVDTVVFATACGTGAGKPAREPFLEALHRLDVPASRAVFVGDDGRCDLLGAVRAGLRAIHLTRTGVTSPWADAGVRSIAAVPFVASTLIERQRIHAA
ncbi:MAG: HAD family hydrolase [Acidobacteria bacterium]|nr:HAD family hydrolase [Acidobacteriota bacterium]